MKHLLARFKLLLQGKFWAFWHYGELGFTQLYYRGKPLIDSTSENLTLEKMHALYERAEKDSLEQSYCYKCKRKAKYMYFYEGGWLWSGCGYHSAKEVKYESKNV